MRLSMKGFSDPYLRTTDEIKLRVIGYSLFDNLMREGGPEFPRMMSCGDYEQANFKKYENQRLAKGAAVALDENHKLVHFWPGRGLKFLGFVGGQSAEDAGVRTRGRIDLYVEGVIEKHLGAKVYCSGPDDFHLNNRSGSACIGKIVYVYEHKPSWALVYHKSWDDPRPEDLHVNFR